jgi:hypothetical protein
MLCNFAKVGSIKVFVFHVSAGAIALVLLILRRRGMVESLGKPLYATKDMFMRISYDLLVGCNAS